MGGHRGLQAEVLASLAMVMVASTAVLGTLLTRAHEAELAPLRVLAARSLVEEARGPIPRELSGLPDIQWWSAAPDGRIRPHGPHSAPPPDAIADVAEDARERAQSLLRAGHAWEPVFFAQPLDDGRVLVAMLPEAVHAGWLLGVLTGVVTVFTAFGAYVFRLRLVLPLQRVAGAARALADGDRGTRVAVDGVRETAEVAQAFNEMSEALESRTAALEKAVAELRESNRNLRSARAGLDRAERLAAVGRLAAGVAHEVGNPMGALLAFLDLAGRDPGLSEVGHGHLDKAAREGERVRVILRQLLDFSRPRRAEATAFDLPALCEETAGLVRAQRRYEGIAIGVQIEGEPPRALADPSAVGQILLNLLLNAADALADTGAPEIRLHARPAVLRAREGDAEGSAARRRFDAVECRVEDNGPGVAPEDRERIFDPFFTTKDPGEGTGLGLANAARTAEELGGSLELDMDYGPGAAFVLRLPAAAAAEGGAARAISD